MKNVGNILPAATAKGSPNSTAEAIEFVVQQLGVANVVVCGHTQCGAMNALLFGLADRTAVGMIQKPNP